MNKKEFDLSVKVSIGVAFIVCCIFILLSGTELSFGTFGRGLSLGISVASLFWWWYIERGWKLDLINNLIHRPQLEGTWAGILKSNYTDKQGNEVPPKVLFLVIRQNFLQLHITSFTDNYIGRSYTETLSKTSDFRVYKLIYLYRKETADPGNQVPDQGVSELMISTDQKEMEGVYFTNVKTKGHIRLEKISNGFIDSFQKGLILNK